MNRENKSSTTSNNFNRLKSEYIEKISESVVPEDYSRLQATKKGEGVKTNTQRLSIGEKDPELPQYEYKGPEGARPLENKGNDKNFQRAGSAVVGNSGTRFKHAGPGNTAKGLSVHWENTVDSKNEGETSKEKAEEAGALGKEETPIEEGPDVLKDTFKVENQVYENVHFIPKLNPFNQKYDEFHEARKGFSKSIRPHSMYTASSAPFAKTENSQVKISEMSNKNPYNVALKNGTEHWKTLYQTEMAYDAKGPVNRSEIPKWVRWDKAHQTGSLVQRTEYMFSYGDLGHDPRHIMGRNAVALNQVDDPLK